MKNNTLTHNPRSLQDKLREDADEMKNRLISTLDIEKAEWEGKEYRKLSIYIYIYIYSNPIDASKPPLGLTKKSNSNLTGSKSITKAEYKELTGRIL